jgi:hypothetical protein
MGTSQAPPGAGSSLEPQNQLGAARRQIDTFCSSGCQAHGPTRLGEALTDVRGASGDSVFYAV